MIFPKWIKKGDTIGVTAFSDGVTKKVDIIRFNNAQKNLNKVGFNVLMTENVFKADEKGRSSEGKIRAEEFRSLLENKDVSAIVSAKGGNFLVEMLKFTDFDLIKENPKWIQGYSDNTSLLYAITTKLDIATAYGCNFGDFGMEEWSESVKRNIDILQGCEDTQKSFEYYEDSCFYDRITGLEGYSQDKPVYWKNLRKEEVINVKGRLIGGCLDVLLNTVGTPYDGTLDFIEKYKTDKTLFYFETFDLDSEQLMMGLWQLKEIGWFKHASGIIFGRPLLFSSHTNTTFEEVIFNVLEDLSIPIILDADIGHKGPQFVMINGAIAEINSSGGKGILKTF